MMYHLNKVRTTRITKRRLKELLVSFLLLVTLSTAVGIIISGLGSAKSAVGQDLPSTTLGDDFLADAKASDARMEAHYYEQIQPSQTALQIINNARAQCENNSFIGNACVSLIYESPQTVVLEGDLLILSTDILGEFAGYWDNPYLWLAVDDFRKGLGYSVTSIELSGQGSKGNPHTWNIVMSK
jgi:hypothetical protein